MRELPQIPWDRSIYVLADLRGGSDKPPEVPEVDIVPLGSKAAKKSKARKPRKKSEKTVISDTDIIAALDAAIAQSAQTDQKG